MFIRIVRRLLTHTHTLTQSESASERKEAKKRDTHTLLLQYMHSTRVHFTMDFISFLAKIFIIIVPSLLFFPTLMHNGAQLFVEQRIIVSSKVADNLISYDYDLIKILAQ